MSLSNTATPRYYEEFRDAVIRGEIPVNNYREIGRASCRERVSSPV